MRRWPSFRSHDIERGRRNEVLYLSVVGSSKVEGRIVFQLKPEVRLRMPLRRFVQGDRAALGRDLASGQRSPKARDKAHVPVSKVSREGRREGVCAGAVGMAARRE